MYGGQTATGGVNTTWLQNAAGVPKWRGLDLRRRRCFARFGFLFQPASLSVRGSDAIASDCRAHFSIALARVFAWVQPRTRQPRRDSSPVKNVKISSYQQVKGPASFIVPMLLFLLFIIGDRAEVARSATQPERRCRRAVRPHRLAATTIPPRLAYRTQ